MNQRKADDIHFYSWFLCTHDVAEVREIINWWHMQFNLWEADREGD